MKRFIQIVALLLALAVSSDAQTPVNFNSTGCTGGVSGTTTAGNDANNISRCSQHNATLCKSKGLAPSCTQGQLDSSSTACAAGACGTIYTNTAGVCTGAGTLAYFASRFFGSPGTALAGEASIMDMIAREIVKISDADARDAYTASKNTVALTGDCTGAGLGAGCTAGQIACIYLTKPSGSPRADCKLP